MYMYSNYNNNKVGKRSRKRREEEGREGGRE